MPVTIHATVMPFAPGQEAKPGQFTAGDFILTHSKGLFATLIRFGQGLRYWGPNRKYIRWSHAALIVSDDGNLVEALDNGVVATHISHYSGEESHKRNLRPMANSTPHFSFAGSWRILPSLAVVIFSVLLCRAGMGTVTESGPCQCFVKRVSSEACHR
jgi:hypothetical protein